MTKNYVARDKRQCSVVGCLDQAKAAKGLCWRHYAHMRRHGKINRHTEKKRYNGQLCCVEGCEKAARSRDMCQTHYNRVKRTGSLHRKPPF